MYYGDVSARMNYLSIFEKQRYLDVAHLDFKRFQICFNRKHSYHQLTNMSKIFTFSFTILKSDIDLFLLGT